VAERTGGQARQPEPVPVGEGDDHGQVEAASPVGVLIDTLLGALFRLARVSAL
jgi:hypothetical protein